MEEINASKNKITSIPSEIKNLRKLKKIDVSGNPISKIPSSITKLQNLEELNLNNTNVTLLSKKMCEKWDTNKISISIEDDKKLSMCPY